MTPRPVGSLGRRLSWWLALKTLVGLGAVCALVYYVFAMSVSARQTERLLEMENLVRHVLEEASVDGDLKELRHRLDDFVAAHVDFGLLLQADAGLPLYQSAAMPAPSRSRTSKFSFPLTVGDARSLDVTMRMGTRRDEQLLQHLAWTLLGAAAIGAVVVSIGGFALVRRGLAPVRDLIEQTRHLAADSIRRQLDGSAQPEELQPLVAQFNALLHRLEQAYDQLEGFNADVAHELCTPLTTLISATELALRGPRRDEEMREILISNLEELRRLTGIVKDMLFLSHADHGVKARREATPSLAQVAASVVEYHEAALDEAHLGVRINGDAAADVDVALLRRALSNLIGNATRYAAPDTTLQVEIAELPKRQVSITVVNRGSTIPADQLPRLFDRFFRGDNVRAAADEHHGLGLAIVAAIARMHGGQPLARSGGDTTSIGLTLAAAG